MPEEFNPVEEGFARVQSRMPNRRITHYYNTAESRENVLSFERILRQATHIYETYLSFAAISDQKSKIDLKSLGEERYIVSQ